MLFEYGSIAFGVLGVLWGVNCYVHLWKWARLCQGANIAIAYNRRVQLNAPLSDWLIWCRQLEGDEKTTGRTVYRNGKMSVSILKPKASISGKTTIRKIRRFRRAKKMTTAT